MTLECKGVESVLPSVRHAAGLLFLTLLEYFVIRTKDSGGDNADVRVWRRPDRSKESPRARY